MSVGRGPIWSVVVVVVVVAVAVAVASVAFMLAVVLPYQRNKYGCLGGRYEFGSVPRYNAEADGWEHCLGPSDEVRCS
jgi:NADH:ubiquinone oxidoreductase subunit 3 (subunit A)